MLGKKTLFDVWNFRRKFSARNLNLSVVTFETEGVPDFVVGVAEDEGEVAKRDVALQPVRHGRGPPFEDLLDSGANEESKSGRRVLRVLGLGDERVQVSQQLQSKVLYYLEE